jgi:hypothetical protein
MWTGKSKEMERNRPERLEDLWSSNRKSAVSDHVLSEDLYSWCSNQELDDFCANRELCESLLDTIVKELHDVEVEETDDEEMLHVVHDCAGCNAPYSLPLVSPSPSFTELTDEIVKGALHRALISLAVASQLINRYNTGTGGGAGVLFSVMAEYKGYGSGFIKKLLQLAADLKVFFPQVCSRAVGLASCVLALSPAVGFASLLEHSAPIKGASVSYDEHMVLADLYVILIANVSMIHTAVSLKEKQFAVEAFLDMSPLLYNLGHWKLGKRSFDLFKDPFIMIIKDLCRLCQMEDDPTDSTDQHGAMFPQILAHYDVGRGCVERAGLYQEQTKVFAVFVGIEVLNFWVHCGLVVNDTMRQDMKVVLQFSRELAQGTPEFLFGVALMESFVHNSHGVELPKQSLLQSMLENMSRRCIICGADKCEDRSPLQKCGGGCSGLAVYCSKAHQKEHWPSHKAFCKKSKSK